MSKSTTIVTTTTALSAIATEISSDTSGRTPSKQHLLSVFARNIAGPKHDWGLLTGSMKPVIQKGIPEARLADLQAIGAPAPRPCDAPAQLRFDETREGITLHAETAPLYSPEMAAYYGSKLTGTMLCLSETFSTDPDFETDVQLMMEPAVHFADPKEPKLDDSPLWAATPDLIERAGAAYFAASASAEVNEQVQEIIKAWPEDYCGYTFKAYYLPHAVVVAPNSPLSDIDALAQNEEDRAEDERLSMIDPDHEVCEYDGFEALFQVVIDQSLDASARARVAGEVENLLIRLMGYLDNQNPRYSNIKVVV